MTVNDFIEVIDRDSIDNLIVLFKGKQYIFRAAEPIDAGELGEKAIRKIELETVDYDGWINAIIYILNKEE